MINPGRLVVIFLAAISLFFLLIAGVILWHWGDLLGAKFAVTTYSQVIQTELVWGIANSLLITLILFIPLYFVSLFINPQVSLLTFKRVFFVSICAFIIGVFLTSGTLIQDLKVWDRLNKISINLENRTFILDRTSFIPLRQYTVKFTSNTQDFSFIEKDIAPKFKELGFSIEDINFIINKQGYTNQVVDSQFYHKTSDLSNIPLTTKTNNFDYGYIRFKKTSKFYDRISVNVTHENGTKGFLRSPL